MKLGMIYTIFIIFLVSSILGLIAIQSIFVQSSQSYELIYMETLFIKHSMADASNSFLSLFGIQDINSSQNSNSKSIDLFFQNDFIIQNNSNRVENMLDMFNLNLGFRRASYITFETDDFLSGFLIESYAVLVDDDILTIKNNNFDIVESITLELSIDRQITDTSNSFSSFSDGPRIHIRLIDSDQETNELNMRLNPSQIKGSGSHVFEYSGGEVRVEFGSLDGIVFLSVESIDSDVVLREMSFELKKKYNEPVMVFAPFIINTQSQTIKQRSLLPLRII